MVELTDGSSGKRTVQIYDAESCTFRVAPIYCHMLLRMDRVELLRFSNFPIDLIDLSLRKGENQISAD